MDTDDRFFADVELLTEACRLSPEFETKLDEAHTDPQVDALLPQARRIVDEASEQAWV